MTVASTKKAMVALARRWARQGRSIGFVPTMGSLHEGHASLIRRARKENARVAVSIFVNPKQFGPDEDYARYPRSFAADRRLCAAAGADAIYHPTVEQVYPPGFASSVEVAGLSERLCGAFRPGHFRGVATVVLKLLETVRPTRAYFGEKDFQQLVIVRRMADDLDLDCRIVGCPTVREKDGLALSSRNAYLSDEERGAAPAIRAALELGAKLWTEGKPRERVEAAVKETLAALGSATIDYASVVDPETLAEPTGPRARLLAAVRLGRTRLIDNLPLRRR